MFQTARVTWSSIYTIACYYSSIQVVQHVDKAEKYEQPAVYIDQFPLTSANNGFFINSHFSNIGQKASWDFSWSHTTNTIQL
jgi:hypothetical protein